MPVDGERIPPMSVYRPNTGTCPKCPKDYRVLDCWQCFEAQGKVCMDKTHGSLLHHVETSRRSAVFCCKQDYNEGYCKEGETHGDDAAKVEMLCSPSSFGPSGQFTDVLTANRNYQMFAYCPQIDREKCGIPGGGSSTDMRLKASTEKSEVRATKLRYLQQGRNKELGRGVGSEEAEYDACYYELVMDDALREKWNPTKLNVKITKKSA